MKQAGISITYAGVDISKYMYVQMVKRDIGTTHVNTMQKVGISDGQMLQYTSRDVKQIVVTGIVANDNLVPLRRSLAAAIDTDEPQQLIFGDEPDKYYLAIVDSQPTFTEGFRSGTISISFVCPDGGIAHSVATQTANNMPYKDMPVNLYLKSKAVGDVYSINGNAMVTVEPFDSTTNMWHIVAKQGIGGALGIFLLDYANEKLPDSSDWAYSADVKGTGKPATFGIEAGDKNPVVGTIGTEWSRISQTGRLVNSTNKTIVMYFDTTNSPLDVYIKLPKLEIGKMPSMWSPNPADPEYYTNTITVHNGGTYPVEPVITATMHADNGFIGFANSQGGVLQFGNPEEIDGYASEESEVALNLAAVQGSHMDNQAASNNIYWGDNPATPNEQIGNAIWTEDRYDGWKVEPNWSSITGDHKYWNGPSIKHNLAQTHNGNFKSNLTWDVMTRFQTGVSKVGSLETTLESDGKPIFQMILKDNSALSDQIWWMCYYKDQLVVNEQLDRNIFTNDKFIQLELQKFGNSVVFRVSPWVGNRGRETTITRQ
ncbi:putative phage tail protein, partial [Lacticaseibacillus paracasei subsp. paracasei Lpp41]